MSSLFRIFVILIVSAVSLAIADKAGAAELVVINPDYEMGEAGNIPGWSLGQHVGEDAYEMTLDTEKPAQGKHSLKLKRIREQVYGMAEQVVNIPAGAQEKSLVVSAALKSEDVGPEGWGLVLTFHRAGAIVGQVTSAKLTGTRNWQQVAVQAKIPPGANLVSIAAILFDRGSGWVDDIRTKID